MKFLELTGFGNKHKHLISLRSIADIEFGMSYTHISLTNGSVVNVIEDEEEIMDMIKYQNGDVVNAQFIENMNAQIEAWNEIEADRFYLNDDLPF
jgi:hypothetical protein